MTKPKAKLVRVPKFHKEAMKTLKEAKQMLAKPKARKPTKKARKPAPLKFGNWIFASVQRNGAGEFIYMEALVDETLMYAREAHDWLTRAIAYLEAQKRGGT